LADTEALPAGYFGAEGKERVVPKTRFFEAALAALQDDLNTPEAITHMHAAVQGFYAAREEHDTDAVFARHVDVVQTGLLLGLFEMRPQTWFRWTPKSAPALDETKIAELIDLRLAARKAKNFTEADRIRDELAQQGVILEDGPKGTTWRRAG